MASLPDDTLRRILMQIQQAAIDSRRALTVTEGTLSAKERERKILQLTIDEITSLKEDVNVYKGVGKMFLFTPRPVMSEELRKQEKELADDVKNLKTKAKYLEKQANEAQAQLRDIFRSAPKS